MAKPSYDPNVLQQALTAAQRFGATPRETKALIEAGLVESGLQNLHHGDADSVGFLQQRPSQGWKGLTNVSAAATEFLKHARAVSRGGFKGSSGALAQAVQRSAYPGRYDQQASQAQSLLGAVGARPGAVAASVGSGPAGADSSGLNAGVAALLAAGQQRPQIQSAGIAPPAFSAHPTLPQGAQLPQGGGGPQPQGPNVNALLALVAGQGGQAAAPASSAVASAGGSQPSATGGSGRLPTARPGKIIGNPYSGTHTLGNWQSDNAVDIAVPVGTPMVALQDGQVVKVTKHPQGAGRFAGDQITIKGANGNEYFYAHGVADVKPGEKIRKGQSLGTTGSANGVAHLHFGQMKGDPRQHTGR